MNMVKDLIYKANEYDSFLKKIMTDNEIWCFLYNLHSKSQSSEWKTKTPPRKEKFLLNKSWGKLTLKVFFDYEVVFHHELVHEV